MKIGLLEKNTSKIMGGEGPNDNWFELRFSTVGPDRRGYHSSFMHNKKLLINVDHHLDCTYMEVMISEKDPKIVYGC